MDADFGNFRNMMHLNLLSIVPAVSGFIAGVAMTIAEVEGLATFSLFEKLGTTGIVAAGAYLIIRWLLGERQKDRDRLDEMHQQRYEELKALLDKAMKDKQ